MWSIEAWDEIQLFLPDNGYGDRVVITTRLSNMAALLNFFPFEMKLLDEEKGWRLLCEKVFGKEECPPEIEEIGKDIVRKCKGLALSIVVIGGRLRKSSRRKHWERVGNDINLVLDSEEDQCMSILFMSYNHLPAHLKPCFLYTGIFKEDELIDVPRLISLWVAEGLVKANEERSKEEIAEECLKDLIDRNLILVHRWDDMEKYYSCEMHDLIRELSIRGCLLRGSEVKNFSLSEDVCKRIPNIKLLNLIYDFSGEFDEASMYYYLQNLGCFHKMESLSCAFSWKPGWDHFARYLIFPSSLQKLRLMNFPLRWDDLTVISSLPQLVELELFNSGHGSEWNTVEMGFSCLRLLEIYACDSLVTWNAESSHFPKLEFLILMGAFNLDEVPSSIGDIPTLKRITMYYCSDSAVISAARILVEQQELGNDELHLEVRFTRKEELESFSEML